MEKEEAIKILRGVHDNALFSVRNALETLIPELKESEDERILNEIIETIETTRVEALRDFPNCSVLQESYWEMLRWLKSLKNRENFLKSNINSTSWKPSKEQMKAVICAIEECGYNSGLESLYNDLKKL